MRKLEKQLMNNDENGFTLVELIFSLTIMGMIIFVVNVMLISVLKSSARTDTMIRLDNYLESSYEIIERNIKSAEPSSICIAEYNENDDIWNCNGEASGNAVKMNLISERRASVVFYSEENEEEVGILKSKWTKADEQSSETITYLTSPNEIDLEVFEVDIALDYSTGIHQVILRSVSDSIDTIGVNDPLVNDMLRNSTIVTRGKQI